MGKTAPLGFAHYHSDEELRQYRKLSPEQKLQWLAAAWRMTVDFLPPSKLWTWQVMRKGSTRTLAVPLVRAIDAWRRCDQALESQAPAERLEALVGDLRTEGFSTRDVYDLLIHFLDGLRLRRPREESREALVADTCERLRLIR